jgi:hypothetical protein
MKKASGSLGYYYIARNIAIYTGHGLDVQLEWEETECISRILVVKYLEKRTLVRPSITFCGDGR